MAKESLITIIDDKRLRGVVAPVKTISKELLEDMIDLVELSSSKVARERRKRIAEADKRNAWIPLEQVKKLAAKTK